VLRKPSKNEEEGKRKEQDETNLKFLTTPFFVGSKSRTMPRSVLLQAMSKLHNKRWHYYLRLPQF